MISCSAPGSQTSKTSGPVSSSDTPWKRANPVRPAAPAIIRMPVIAALAPEVAVISTRMSAPKALRLRPAGVMLPITSTSAIDSASTFWLKKFLMGAASCTASSGGSNTVSKVSAG